MTRLLLTHGCARLVALVSVLGSTTPVWANAGPSATSVNVVAEPVGIEHVRIARETLTIDLRPLETGDAVIVEAVYNLQNDGPEQTLDLLFAFGTQENSDFSFTLDGQPIAGVLQESNMPSEWTPPRFTPGLDGDDDVTYAGSWSTVLPMSFSIVVPPGPSVLSARYLAGVKYTYARPAMFRQFAYILSPARSWADFGGLDVTIHVPDDWSVASEPVVEREGGLLQGSFDDIPADAIGVTLRPPVGGGYRAVKNSAWGLFALVGVAGLAFCWRWGGHHQLSEVPLERHRSRSRRFAGALMIGVAFGVAVFLAGMAAAWGADTLFPPTDGELALVKQLRLSDGYGPLAAVVGIMFLSVLAAGTGCVLTLSRRGRAIS